MSKRIIGLLFLLVSMFAYAAPVVTVSTPTNGATVTSPVEVKASSTATSGWHVYLDGTSVWHSSTNTKTIDAKFSAAAGAHALVVRAWDSSGAYGTVRETITVAPAMSMNVTSPVNGFSGASPVKFTASATSPNGIDGWVVYVDGNNVYQSSGGHPTLDASVDLAAGAHTAFLRAWDTKSGYVTSPTLALTVQAPTPNPYVVAPDTATTLKQEQNNPLAYWKSTTSEAGGQIATSFPTTAGVTDPSLSGSSRGFSITGPAWSAALWYHKLNLVTDAYTHFLVDYDFYLDPSSRVHTLEYDTMQVVGGHEYMIGSHCNFDYGYWYGWNQVTGSWIKTDAPCNWTLLPAGKWHHVQWHMERIPNSTNYKYDTLVMDGVRYDISLTEPSSVSSWSNNVTVQWQIDQNGSGGTSKLWIDNVTVSLW